MAGPMKWPMYWPLRPTFETTTSSARAFESNAVAARQQLVQRHSRRGMLSWKSHHRHTVRHRDRCGITPTFFGGGPMKRLPDIAIKECVRELRAACRLPIDQAALDLVVDWLRPNFELSLAHPEGGRRWADHGHRMRDNARYRGAFADFL